MDPADLDVAIDELETRLERLRALYEQYFLGIEKTAPAVVRADVDRRIWALRKEQIRNALSQALVEKEYPTLIIGKTVMGKGARTATGDLFEGKVSTHGMDGRSVHRGGPHLVWVAVGHVRHDESGG